MYEIENVLAKNEFFRPTFGAMILFLDQMNSNKGRFLIVTGHMVASWNALGPCFKRLIIYVKLTRKLFKSQSMGITKLKE